MRWAGEGSELWRVRVDLFAEVRDARREVSAISQALSRLLEGTDGDARSFIGVDQGTGAAGHPVIGLLFWVRANDVGSAAMTAVDIARRAGASAGAGPSLYDVTVIPRDAVVLPTDVHYPSMPD